MKKTLTIAALAAGIVLPLGLASKTDKDPYENAKGAGSHPAEQFDRLWNKVSDRLSKKHPESRLGIPQLDQDTKDSISAVKARPAFNFYNSAPKDLKVKRIELVAMDLSSNIAHFELEVTPLFDKRDELQPMFSVQAERFTKEDRLLDKRLSGIINIQEQPGTLKVHFTNFDDFAPAARVDVILEGLSKRSRMNGRQPRDQWIEETIKVATAKSNQHPIQLEESGR